MTFTDPPRMLTERCACGATFETRGPIMETLTNAVAEWRKTHRHDMPVRLDDLDELTEARETIATLVDERERLLRREAALDRLAVELGAPRCVTCRAAWPCPDAGRGLHDLETTEDREAFAARRAEVDARRVERRAES